MELARGFILDFRGPCQSNFKSYGPHVIGTNLLCDYVVFNSQCELFAVLFN